MKLLAVDDDPIFLDLLVSTLKELGYDNITPVKSAMEALHELAIATDPFDCLLFDIQMPVKNGIDLTKEVRQQARYALTPIIMITSMQQRDFIDQAYAAGANDYVVKPIQSLELAARIGMVKKVAELNDQVRHAASKTGQTYRFSDAIPLEPRDNILNYLALENYLLTLGRLRMSNICAFGVSLVGASDRFASAPIDEYTDILNDIAAIVVDHTIKYRPLISYAGSGQFIVVLPRAMGLDTEDLAAFVNAELESLYTSVYLPEEMGAEVRMGPVHRPRMLKGFSPNSMITKVLGGMSDQVQGARYKQLWKSAA